MNAKSVERKFFAWVSIARLQFYPMTWLAYTLGAVAQSTISKGFNAGLYLLGYLVLFLIELCTILVNEYNDYETDRLNDNFSIFTGGTRVIVDGRLSFQEVKRGIIFLLLLIPLLGYALTRMSAHNSEVSGSIFIAIGLFLGLGYTMPPVRFSYRGLGEFVVSVTHSVYVILCGFVFQGGIWHDPRPWFLSIPLFFSIFAAITLAGLPDRLADKAVRKKTLAVIFGPRVAVLIAISCVCLSYLSALLLTYDKLITLSVTSWNLLVLPHGAFLVFYLLRLMKTGQYGNKINREMGLSLSYIIWFALIPLCSIWL
jgi:1,4-dihydroxy-2-naphthoate octaprenyltransferase